MAKQSGLGDNLYVAQYDLSGDTQMIDSVSCPRETLDVTGIDKSAFERIGGKRDGLIDWTTHFNTATDKSHDALSSLPTTDRIVTYCRGTTLGNPAASMVAKQITYDGTREDSGQITFKVSANANAYGLEWGRQLTAGIDSMSGAGDGTSIDYGATIGTTAFGLQAYLHVFSFTGTDATFAIQSSTDDGAGDAYATIAGASFTQVTGVTSERIQTARDASVERYLRLNVSGTFSAMTFMVNVVKNQSTVNF